MFKFEKIEYRDGDTILEGYCAYDDKAGNKKPAVLVAHDWSGCNDFARRKAEKLAELGYVGFAVDMYGKGKIGTTKEEKSDLMQPLMQDRSMLQRRMLAAFDAMKQIEAVDTSKTAAIGFCFGGLCALDLARSGADISGVVSFHGLLGAAEDIRTSAINAKILVLHGYTDPMVTPDHLVAFGEEMTRANADWQVVIYGNTMHAFTNPEANDPEFGTVYNKKSDARSWIEMKNFFKEVFGK